MQTSRIDTLQAPRGAWWVPLLAFVAVLAVVLTTVVVGLSSWGWPVALFVPVVAFTLYVALRVLIALTGDAVHNIQAQDRTRGRLGGDGRRGDAGVLPGKESKPEAAVDSAGKAGSGKERGGKEEGGQAVRRS